MDLDIVQLRWQQVRSFEASQVISAENLELKKQVVELRRQHREQDRLNKQALRELGRAVSLWTSRARGDLNSLKSECLQEVAGAILLKDTLAEGFHKVQMRGLSQDSALQYLQNERLRLMSEVEEAREGINQANKSKLLEVERHRGQMEKLREELAASDSHRGELMSRVEELEAGRPQAQSRYDALYRQCEGLVVTIQKLELEATQTLADAREAEQRLLADHEQVVGELGGDNAQLRHQIAMLEEQIERLTAALMGNKSHFQKFVELKAENITLHHELKNINSKKLSTQLLVPPAGPGPSDRGRGRVVPPRDGDNSSLGPSVMASMQSGSGHNLHWAAAAANTNNNNSNSSFAASSSVRGGLLDSSTVMSSLAASRSRAPGRTKGKDYNHHNQHQQNQQQQHQQRDRGDGQQEDPRGELGKTMLLAKGRERNRDSHSPIRGSGDDDAQSVMSGLTAATGLRAGQSIVLAAPNSLLLRGVTEINDETPRDYISLELGPVAGAPDVLDTDRVLTLSSPRPGPGLSQSSVSLSAAAAAAAALQALPAPAQASGLLRMQVLGVSTPESSLPLAVPLLSKATREGLVQRHGVAAV
jgi:hypothetical protein